MEEKKKGIGNRVYSVTLYRRGNRVPTLGMGGSFDFSTVICYIHLLRLFCLGLKVTVLFLEIVKNMYFAKYRLLHTYGT